MITAGLMFPKPQARCLRDAAVKAEEEKAQRRAYAAVTRREDKRCRLCARSANEHHHIEPRSRGGRDRTDNLVLLCRSCHVRVQQHVERLAGNPDKRLGLTWAREDGTTARR